MFLIAVTTFCEILIDEGFFTLTVPVLLFTDPEVVHDVWNGYL